MVLRFFFIFRGRGWGDYYWVFFCVFYKVDVELFLIIEILVLVLEDIERDRGFFFREDVLLWGGGRILVLFLRLEWFNFMFSECYMGKDVEKSNFRLRIIGL